MAGPIILLLALLAYHFLSDVTASTQSNRADLAYSPSKYPSPWASPDADGWEDAYRKATAFVSVLSLPEKVNLTTGTG